MEPSEDSEVIRYLGLNVPQFVELSKDYVAKNNNVGMLVGS